MSIKQAAVVAGSLVAAALLFAVVYGTFSRGGNSVSTSTPGGKMNSSQPVATKPVTPDTAADEIEGQSQTDASAFDSSESAELSNIDSTDADVTALNNASDESQLQ